MKSLQFYGEWGGMQIVVPMSGFGERFRSAGFRVPKPLIEVEGRPIISHVIDMFPGETNFLFICNQEHLDNADYRMREILQEFCPLGRIVAIAPHKLGPVNAVKQVLEYIDPDESVIINYCDFTCVWDYNDFKKFVRETNCHGAIPCYTGFHPHMLNSTYYAYVKEEQGRIVGIQEKRPYTDTPMKEYASSGTYYFASGKLVSDYFLRAQAREDLLIGGEHYVSVVYTPMLEDGCEIAVYELNHFMQWGVPNDLGDYNYWSRAFRGLINPRRYRTATQHGSTLVPLAGLGSRFSREGYETPKPLIAVSGDEMVVQATLDLPKAEQRVFVLRRDLPGHADISATLRRRFPGCHLVQLDAVSDGQARSCAAGLAEVDPLQPLTIGACDNGALFDAEALQELLDDPGVDVVVWVARGYPGAVRHPDQHGWVEERDGRVLSVTGKRALSNPPGDPSLIGCFSFKRAADFAAAAQSLFARDGRVNGEYYVDRCINDAIAAGLNCRVFEVDSYLCWGTPDDLLTFEYWQSCFDKWVGHPYRLEDDSRVNTASIPALRERYRLRVPARPNCTSTINK